MQKKLAFPMILLIVLVSCASPASQTTTTPMPSPVLTSAATSTVTVSLAATLEPEVGASLTPDDNEASEAEPATAAENDLNIRIA
ncbi:MAG TPA: hypothetical protein DCX53_00330, partial [Anaerolineae bacterium]|nr:hypothetical protein [Anaerolineae bacterium]